MSNIKELEKRSAGACELCGSDEGLEPLEIGSSERYIMACSKCREQIDSNTLDETHFLSLNDSMWSEVSDVKIMSAILLHKLNKHDLLEMLYLEEDEQKLVDYTLNAESLKIVHKDANGVVLEAGDSIVILKDLEVKGAGFTAKRGTTVTRISLPSDIDDHIEGRVNGTKIFLKTEFIKKV